MVGRIREQDILRKVAKSEESEFVAIYGRRRVGKTYLVRETFEGEFTFSHSGLSRTNMRGQLHAFRNSLKMYGHVKCPAFTNWLDAFEELKQVIMKSTSPKKIVFIDEMPWMDTPRSSFVPALEYFWNSWASARKDILLIVCGSATSWIIDKIIRSRGGLHNRVTEQILLEQFTLSECEEYAATRGLQLTRRQLVELYMVFGGVPYYWHFLERGQSVAQSVDGLMFADNAKLRGEFISLYESLFRSSEPYIAIVKALGAHGGGLNRDELGKASGIASSGHFSKYLEELEECGFIRHYPVLGKAINEAVYQLVDNFTFFALKFARGWRESMPDFWTKLLGTGEYHSWRGHAFERVCLRHVNAIKQAMQIGGVSARVCAYRGGEAQIDMIIDRQDDVINIFEMKYTDDEYSLDEAESRRILSRRSAIAAATNGKKAVHVMLVSAAGFKVNKYSDAIIGSLTLDDLFGRKSSEKLVPGVA